VEEPAAMDVQVKAEPVGKAGEGWRWIEIVGYRYYCIQSCIKTAAHVPTTSLARAGSSLITGSLHVSASTRAMIAPQRAHAISGTDLERFIAQAVLAYRVARTPRTYPGACHCGGGSGNSAGCDMKPIRSTFIRAPRLV
jgi:hypothetical protein